MNTTRTDKPSSSEHALLPCPFCGHEAEIERVGTPRQSTIYACTFCGCRLETGEEWGHGADWNRRAALRPPAPIPIAGGGVGVEAIARCIDPFPWDRRDHGLDDEGDAHLIARSLKIAGAILALFPTPPQPTTQHEGNSHE